MLKSHSYFALQIMDMYKNEEMEYELGPKKEFYA